MVAVQNQSFQDGFAGGLLCTNEEIKSVVLRKLQIARRKSKGQEFGLSGHWGLHYLWPL